MKTRLPILSLLCAALPALLANAVAAPGEDPVPPRRGDVLEIPGLPPVQMPPGTRVFGPDGPALRGGADADAPPAGGGPGTPKPESDANKAPAPGRNAAPGARPPQVDRRTAQDNEKPAGRSAADRAQGEANLPQARKKVLDELFTRLHASASEDEAKGVAGAIERVWMRSESDTADLLMNRALKALQTKDYSLSQEVLDKVIELNPDWVEAWNKRATARFLDDDYSGAMEDISHVLALEPRHFGALSGMGFILQRLGDTKQALRVFRKTLEVYPQLEEIKKAVDKLKIDVEGRDI